MATGDETIRSLRDALRVSPDNVPLRRHLAETLLANGRPEEAEQEYRAALAGAPEDVGLKVGLAEAFHQQGKSSHALVILEELFKLRDTPASAYLLHARILFGRGEIEQAVREYKKAIDVDPDARDPELAALLGIGKKEEQASWDVVDGKVRGAVGGGREKADDDGDEPPEGSELERPKTTFEQVGGMDALKEEIRLKIIHPITHPEIYAAYGKKVGGGILMYGPPGCGKTHLARATAGEVKAWFLAVGLDDVLDMWIGNSEKNLHAVFEQARDHRPCVLFFDEVDALGASRSDMQKSGGRHVINQFLAELDGVKADNEGVLILGATNAPWHLDSAFRRPGRFDRIIFVPPPDGPGRAEILRLLLAGKPVEKIDYEWLAKKTEGFSGADLEAVVDVAIEAKLREAMKAGAPSPLTSKDLAAAAKTRRPTTKEWFATARNYAIYSNQGGIYDDVIKYLKL